MKFINKRNHKYFEQTEYNNSTTKWDFVASIKSSDIWIKNNRKRQYKKDYDWIKSFLEKKLKRKLEIDWSSADTIYFKPKVNSKNNFYIRISNHWGNYGNSNNELVNIPKKKKIFKWRVGII